MRRLVALLGAIAFASAACGPGSNEPSEVGAASFRPGDPILLTPNSPAEDEDPSVLRNADGRLVVAFFSRRDGNADIYVTSTRDGVTWTGPTRVTTSAEDDFTPNLIQDSAGRFHLTWFRRAPAPTYYAHVRYTSTTELATWSPNAERQVTSAPGFLEDWVPTIAQARDGRLVIVFTSRIRVPGRPHDLYAVRSDNDGATWSAPVPLHDLNAPREHDHLPFVARTGDALTIVWVRHDDTNATPWLNASADVFIATSTDGLAWTAPVNVTHDDAAGALDLFPSLYARHAGEWSLAWVSTAISPTGSVFDLPIAGVAAYPAGRSELPLSGYSPRVVATPTQGVFLGAWVQGATGAQDVYVRFFQKYGQPGESLSGRSRAPRISEHAAVRQCHRTVAFASKRRYSNTM